MIPILDYTPLVAKMISESYAPENTGVDGKVIEKSLSEITGSLCAIFPSENVTEQMIFEVLTNLGFEPTDKGQFNYKWRFVVKEK